MVKSGKENNIFIVISILIFLATIFSFTYAFFSANVTSTGSLNAIANIEDTMLPIFTAIPDGDLELNISEADMLQGDANNTSTVLTASENITVSLLGGSTNEQVSCSFKFIWDELPGSTTYTPSTGRGSLKENTIKIVDDNNTPVVYETNVDSFSSGSPISGYQTITSNGTLTTRDYIVTQSFYNLDLNQTMYNASYKTRVRVGNVECPRSHPTGYWFALSPTWNGNTRKYEPTYTPPSHGGTLQSSGSLTGNSIYIGLDSNRNYVCATIDGHELCLLQPYTQYGLMGHTVSSGFTTDERDHAKLAIYQAFIDAGISLDATNNCNSSSSSCTCAKSGVTCGVSYDGSVFCWSGDYECNVYYDGSASCGEDD